MIQNVSTPAALLAGLVSFLSPCVLPLVPPYLIYLTGATIEHVANEETESSSRRKVMISALLFVAGFSTAFVLLGASASPIGGLRPARAGRPSGNCRVGSSAMGPPFPWPDRDGPLV